MEPKPVGKTYGGRWEICSQDRLGQGGQASVFRVRDKSGEYPGEYALKRVFNPTRRTRFEREIQAVENIRHPNVIEIIDHSALSDSSATAEKQYLVMPLAEGGDLWNPARAKSFAGSIDSTIQVAKQLASALAAAHSVNVIHRDVKPGNVLFSGLGHDVWLSDFGICLIREEPRITDTGEVVGPRHFLAPELEDGSQLDVTFAADVYSLGKVIFYLFSGGMIIPREGITDVRFSSLLQEGERQGMLYVLLQQMICPLAGRVRSMEEVLRRLESLEDWDKRARVLPLSANALGSLQRLQLQTQESLRFTAVDQSNRDTEAQLLANLKLAFIAWIQAELDKVSAHISTYGTFRSEVRVWGREGFGIPLTLDPGRMLESLCGGMLSISREDRPNERHTLFFGVYRELDSAVQATGSQAKMPVAEPVRDFQLACIPTLRRTVNTSGSRQVVQHEFFTKKDAIHQILVVQPVQGARRPRLEESYVTNLAAVTQQFVVDASQAIFSSVSAWTRLPNELSKALEAALESFMEFVASAE